ncbi:MAG: hypothetical protein F4X11_16070 [Acidobacteria bacterium]|nr:hypothetical protein [Acidobacteriota bacterium]
MIELSVGLAADSGEFGDPQILGAAYTGPEQFCDAWWIDVSWRADAPAGATITLTEPLPDSATRTRTDMDLWNDGIWVSVPADTDSEVKLSLQYEGAVQDETTLFVDRPGTASDSRSVARAPLPRFCNVTHGPPTWNPPVPELVEGFWDVTVSWEAVGPPRVEVEIYGPLDDFPYSLQGYLTSVLDIPVPGDRDSEIIVLLEVDGREQDRRVLTVARPS